MGWSKRYTETGLVANGACNLFAVTVNFNSSVDTVVSLKDSVDSNGDIVWETWATSPGCVVKNFYPILHFENGIYLEIDSSVYSVILEYL